MKTQELAYLAGYAFKTFILRQAKPLIAGMPLTDICNLQCQHCVVANTGRGHYSYIQVEKLMQHFYDLGVRILYLQGGEIMTWQDETLRADDIIRRAKEIGFFKVAAVTNGTLGLPAAADLIWISLDGSEAVHDSIRGAGAFAKVMQNLRGAKHPRLNLNMTINRLNAGEVEKVARIAGETPNVHGVSFNFHTPYPGVEGLALSLEERSKVIERILSLKKNGFPVLNTFGGLKALQKNNWRRPISIIQLVEKGQIYQCCWGKDQAGVCEKCGYGVIAELSQILSFNIPTIVESLALFK
jgi:MoaA/NifB/PqqE/SkfB family radical SAM enzyme